MKDRDVLFHEKWLGLAQPIEGLVFSVPVLADAQIAPDLSPGLSTTFAEHLLRDEHGPRIRHLPAFLRSFLGYSREGMLVPRGALPDTLSFYAPEGGQEIRPSFALGRGPFVDDDPFALFAPGPSPSPDAGTLAPPERFFALIWDLTEHQGDLDLDAPEDATGPWRYAPTAKFERLLRHAGIPVGLLFNGRELRLLYAPAGETTGHLTFRVAHMDGPEGRPLLAAMELLLHARRAYSASPEHTLGGLLGESRRRQADVTEKLAKQVFEAVEILIAGFEAAAAREGSGARHDWLRHALEAEGDHFYQGILSVVLRLVFLLYSEDQSLLPVEHPLFAEHLSLAGLHQRLSYDAGAHPESMHHRFGAYGQLLALFRAVFFGVKHGDLSLPPRRGRLFDPNTYPFLEGGLPHWTAAVADPEARAAVRPPNIDDGTIHRVLHRLVVFEGQRLSYRTLDVEQIGSIYESLMGYHVVRLISPAVRMGKFGVWVEVDTLRSMSPADRARFLKETCGLNPGPIQAIEKLFREASAPDALLDGLASIALGKKADLPQHRAPAGRLVLQPGEERRRTGSHYTPRSLTEKVVKRTLEPLLACLGPHRTADQILELKICDPAMGSGAFLVATCRELASEIVAAWAREQKLAAVVETHGNAHLHACRLVAQRCLYGVDKNPAAVELAKLSLWLVTLSRSLPFTFVDHALRHGDSLVGLDFKQIQSFHWAPSKQTEIFKDMLEEALEQAVSLRQQIASLAFHDDPDAQAEKRRLFDFSQQAIDRVRTIADACVGAFFAEQKDAAREKERNRRLDLIATWLTKPAPASDAAGAEIAKPAPASDAAGAEIARLASDARSSLSPFHWWIEFPEVFFLERPDPLQGGARNGAAMMDGVVGNPPFGGKNNIVDGNASGYLDWLKVISPGAHGNADLSAHFFRRTAALLGHQGALGIIATNTIAQGDTRTTGISHLVDSGWKIFDATDSTPWPGSAGVVVSIVHAVSRGLIGKIKDVKLNGRVVTNIDSRLRSGNERAAAVKISANKGSVFVGTYVLGIEGFSLSSSQMERLIALDARNKDRIFPYIGGEEINTRSAQDFDRH
nr:N-6 DNA methylase [Polyangiaceae bacterium]